MAQRYSGQNETNLIGKENTLMIDLLIPEDLMTEPPKTPNKVTVEYSHEDQTSFTMQSALDRVELAQNTMYCMSTSTFSGTQPFDYSGNPTDSDSDSDSQGDC